MAALIAISPRVRRTDTPSRRMRAIGRPDAALATARPGSCSDYLLHSADPSADVHDRRKRSTDHLADSVVERSYGREPKKSARVSGIGARASPKLERDQDRVDIDPGPP